MQIGPAQGTDWTENFDGTMDYYLVVYTARIGGMPMTEVKKLTKIDDDVRTILTAYVYILRIGVLQNDLRPSSITLHQDADGVKQVYVTDFSGALPFEVKSEDKHRNYFPDEVREAAIMLANGINSEMKEMSDEDKRSVTQYLLSDDPYMVFVRLSRISFEN
jgi:RIO-like serine/threonine protein kinase